GGAAVLSRPRQYRPRRQHLRRAIRIGGIAMRLRLSTLSVGLVLIVLLAGCGSASTTPTNTAAPNATAPPGATTAGSSSGSSTTSSSASSPATTAAANFPPPIPADKQVNIVFYSYNLATAGLGKEATEQLISEFQQKFPNIHVEGRGVPSSDI